MDYLIRTIGTARDIRLINRKEIAYDSIIRISISIEL